MSEERAVCQRLGGEGPSRLGNWTLGQACPAFGKLRFWEGQMESRITQRDPTESKEPD